MNVGMRESACLIPDNVCHHSTGGILASLREEIEHALQGKDFEKVAGLALDQKRVFRTLISLTYDKEDLLCWRAIEAVGRAAGAVSKRDPSIVRDIVERLIWSMREESGGIGWSAPEMLGEIVLNAPDTCADIPPIILSFHEEESFLKGVLWSMGRITRAGIGGGEGLYEIARACLSHGDPLVRGLALRAIPRSRLGETADEIRAMAGDEGRFSIYEDHELIVMRVGDMAAELLER